MEGQTTTLSRPFGEKMIRLASSAAVCGLTLSFLFGEMVDANPGIFNSWVPASHVIPKEYPAAAPLTAFLNNLENGEWAGKVKDGAIAEGSVELDEIELAEAQLPKINEDLKREREVQKIMAEVHEATATVIEDKAVSKAAAPQAMPVEKEISGKIIIEGARPTRGHFEVVVHKAIDADKNPVGFPLAQKILKPDEPAYSLKLPSNDESKYLFLKFYGNPSDSTATKIFFHGDNPVGPASIANGAAFDFQISGLVPEGPRQKENEKTVAITGKISAMFSGGAQAIGEAVIKVRGGTAVTMSSESGSFSLNIPDFSGEIFLEVIRRDFFPTIISVNKKSIHGAVSVELISREAVDKLAGLLGLRQSRSKSLFIGTVSSGKATTASGVTAALSLKADGPYYFSPQGSPVGRDTLKSTSSDGRFIFFNLESGIGTLDLSMGGDPVAPVLVSPVEGGGVIHKALRVVDGKVRGRVFNPVAGGTAQGRRVQPITGARLRAEGSLEWGISDSFGAFELPQFRYVQGEPISIELTADKFYTHRYQAAVRFEETGKKKSMEVNLFAFPSSYVNDLASSLDVSLDPYSGLVLGGVGTGKSLRIDALSDHSPVNGSRDYYFDETGGLRGSHSGTHPAFGTFVIFNVPKGRTLLQGLDQSGRARFYSSVFTGPSIVSVILD